MRHNAVRLHFAGLLATAFAFAGCSGGQGLSTTPESPQGSPQSVLQAVSSINNSFASAYVGSTGTVAMSDGATAGTVWLYNQRGVNFAKISGFDQPNSLAFDQAGNLYVADNFNGQVVVYKNDYKTILRTLDDTGQYTEGVAVASDGTVAITGLNSAFFNVSFYAPGATTACATVPGAQSILQNAFLEAFDANGNLYFEGQDTGGLDAVRIAVITGGCTASKITVLTTTNTIAGLGGISVLKNGNLLVLDSAAEVLYEYKPALSGSLGSPVKRFKLRTPEPFTFALTSAESGIWVSGLGRADFYKYPPVGSPTKIIGQQYVEGLAVTPADIP